VEKCPWRFHLAFSPAELGERKRQRPDSDLRAEGALDPVKRQMCPTLSLQLYVPHPVEAGRFQSPLRAESEITKFPLRMKANQTVMHRGPNANGGGGRC